MGWWRMVDTKPNSPTSNRVSNAVRIAILSPAVLVFISAVRLLMIANYDPTTASAIASATGVVGTLLGTLIPVVPALLPPLLLVLIILRKWLLALFAAIGTALVSPSYATLKEAWMTTVNQFTAPGHALTITSPELRRHALGLSWMHDRASLIFGVIAVLVIAFDNRDRILASYPNKVSHPGYSLVDKVLVGGGKTLIWLFRATILCLCYAIAVFFITTIYHIPFDTSKISAIASQPWLPSEIDTLKSGDTIVGYTLSAGDVWYVSLREQNRTIDYLHSDDIVSRELCQLPETQRANRPPLIKLINAPTPTVPPCPIGS